MADEVLVRDQNFRTVVAGVTNDSDQDITMLRVDPITDELLVEITGDSATLANAGEIAQRDQNYKPVCLAYDETNNTLSEVLTDEDGYLLVDVEFT